jgi:hypothetical protein
MHKKQVGEDDTTYSRVRLLVTYCLERDTFLRSTKTALVGRINCTGCSEHQRPFPDPSRAREPGARAGFSFFHQQAFLFPDLAFGSF